MGQTNKWKGYLHKSGYSEIVHVPLHNSLTKDPTKNWAFS